MLLVDQNEMDPICRLYSRGLNIIPIWNPVSILNIALLSTILTVAHLHPRSMIIGTLEAGEMSEVQSRGAEMGPHLECNGFY